jgi:2-desacetyl-2-hydroxyethyl bacteriochlorophyllide A dehydrogenase
MLAGVFRGIGDIRLEQVARPSAGEAGIVVAVEACGICGSDLHSVSSGAYIEPGQIMGHEFAGLVVEVGEGARGMSVGDRVTASAVVPCGLCPQCDEGRANICVTGGRTGIGYGAPGAFAEFIHIPGAVRDENVFILPEGVSAIAGATVEPLAVATHAVRVTPPVLHQTVVVLGLGTIGQQVVQVAIASGAVRVIAVDITDVRLDIAARFGAVPLRGGPDLESDLMALLGEGQQIDAVFECSGVPALAALGLRVVKSGGTLAMVALYGAPVKLDATDVVRREVRVQGCHAYTPEDWVFAVDLVATGRVQVEPLVTQVEPLERLVEAFTMQADKDRALKVVVTP